ncbi:prohibitin family protein [Desulfosporosinus nitroreducens]|uniref:Prohibitin family protein n=1 Tax=Desulfosporosinus nitroreducens TaxID=2018668 RepID=A0ABT8QWH6_9FIRM|nr:prohibitin family protein [Desulfosporosinus nitroreducens]MDO0825695.1 prohibitin family protein [Desulfosporosinus nitroreducens]
MDSKKIVNMVPKLKISPGLITFGIVIIVIFFTALNSFVIVNAGHRGIVLQLGAVRPVVFTEGLHFKIPFIQDVIPIDVRVQKSQSDQTAASKDLQIVTTTVAVNFHLDPNQANTLYQSVGLSYGERIVDPAIGEAVKAVTAQYTAEELISKRSEVSSKIKETLSSKLATYYMILDEINITEFKFSQEFNNAIEQKQIAEQQALKANLDLQRIEIEAKQKIEQAKAEAESLRLQKQEVTAELVKLREIEAQIKAIEKWDGKLPNVTGGAVPFVDVNNAQ